MLTKSTLDTWVAEMRKRGLTPWTITVTLLDTGLRIDEVLGLERSNVDLPGRFQFNLGRSGRSVR